MSSTSTSEAYIEKNDATGPVLGHNRLDTLYMRGILTEAQMHCAISELRDNSQETVDTTDSSTISSLINKAREL